MKSKFHRSREFRVDVEKVKKLIENSDITASELSKKLGYNPSYIGSALSNKDGKHNKGYLKENDADHLALMLHTTLEEIAYKESENEMPKEINNPSNEKNSDTAVENLTDRVTSNFKVLFEKMEENLNYYLDKQDDIIDQQLDIKKQNRDILLAINNLAVIQQKNNELLFEILKAWK